MWSQSIEILLPLRIQAEGGSSGKYVWVSTSVHVCQWMVLQMAALYSMFLLPVMFLATSYHKHSCCRELLMLFRLGSSSKFVWNTFSSTAFSMKLLWGMETDKLLPWTFNGRDSNTAERWLSECQSSETSNIRTHIFFVLRSNNKKSVITSRNKVLCHFY